MATDHKTVADEIADRNPRSFEARWRMRVHRIADQPFTLAAADTCCMPGYTRAQLVNQSRDQPAFVFVADESPLHRKLGVYEERA